MLKYICALFCALLVLSAFEPIQCRKNSGGGGYSRGGGSHNYPSSHGLSGSGRGGSHGYPSSGGSHGYPSSGGSHGYPSSGGLSGSGSSHGYPSSGGLSGGGSKYPPAASGGMSGGSHGYPSSGGVSGGGSKYPPAASGGMSGGSHGYPSSGGGLSGGGSKYPASGGSGYPSSSGKQPSYPSSNGGLSGSGSHGYPKKPNYGGRTTINNHYHYSPPQQITYAAPGHRAVSYPVYHGTPPPVVYQYKNSGSKYGTLLAGLALLNLGTLAAGAAYVGTHSHTNYKPQPGEICKFAIRKANGDYEETKIDCQMITSFIFQEEAKSARTGPTGTNTTVVTTTVTNVTMVNTTSGDSGTSTLPPPSVLYQMLPNGTLVPVNVTAPSTSPPTTMLPNGTLSSMTVTTTTTNTTVVNALDVKGKEVVVTPGMECFVIRHTPTQNMKKHVPCGLLQSYATQSLKPNSAVRNIPTFTILIAVAALLVN